MRQLPYIGREMLFYILPSSSKTWYWLPGTASMMRWLESLALGWSVVAVQSCF